MLNKIKPKEQFQFHNSQLIGFNLMTRLSFMKPQSTDFPSSHWETYTQMLNPCMTFRENCGKQSQFHTVWAGIF